MKHLRNTIPSNFEHLLRQQDSVKTKKYEENIFDIISLVGCSLYDCM